MARCVTDVKCEYVYNESKKCKEIAALMYCINNEDSVSKRVTNSFGGNLMPDSLQKINMQRVNILRKCYPEEE